MSTTSAPTTECAIAIIDGKLYLALREPGSAAVAVSLTSREADALAGRLRKAASDLRASEARQR